LSCARLLRLVRCASSFPGSRGGVQRGLIVAAGEGRDAFCVAATANAARVVLAIRRTRLILANGHQKWTRDASDTERVRDGREQRPRCARQRRPLVGTVEPLVNYSTKANGRIRQ
jgi:hypothetical protein